MKTYTKSFNVLFIAVIIILLSACSGGSGCGTWGKIQTKKQYHAHVSKDNKNFANYKGYNN